MATPTFSVLFVDDLVVLPEMVVPLELTTQTQATVDAARAGHGEFREPLRLMLVPRVEGRTGVMGTVAEVTQLGRLPSGEPAAVLRATHRARIGTGVTGPGAALWVEAEILDVPAVTRGPASWPSSSAC
jgi:ATP-dependent Lon protease